MEPKEQENRSELSEILKEISSEYQRSSEEEKAKLSKYMRVARAEALIDALNLMKLPELITLPDKVKAMQDELSASMAAIKRLNTDTNGVDVARAGEKDCWIIVIHWIEDVGIKKFYGTREEVKKWMMQEAKEEEKLDNWLNGPVDEGDFAETKDLISMTIEYEDGNATYFARQLSDIYEEKLY